MTHPGPATRCIAPAFGLGLLWQILPAQTASRAPAATAEEAIVLSPFSITSAKDVGYEAAESLAGTGLKTKLTDLGSAVSVITSKFLEDTASFNLRDVLVYQANMEVTGFGGNYSGAGVALGAVTSEPNLGNGPVGNINNDQIVGDGTRNSPQTQNRTRGLSGPNSSRGYFTSDFGFDAYNTDGVTVLGGGDLKLNAIKTTAIQNGLSSPTSFWDAPAGVPATERATGVTVPMSLKEIFNGGSRFRETITSKAAILQSYWLDNHLVTTGGLRRDESVRLSPRTNFAYDPLQPDSIVKGFDDYNVYSFPRVDVGKEVKSYSAVLRWPQKLARLPWGMDASAFLNVSSNFTPLGSRINYLGDFVKSPAGKTREYGLNLSFRNDRLSLRYNRYDTAVVGQGFNPPFNYTNAIVQMTGFWISENNANRNPTIDRKPEIEKIFAALPSNFRSLYGFAYTGSAATSDQGQIVTGLSGVSDTTDFSAKGHELDIVFNPMRQWRILANFAQSETVPTNIAPTPKTVIAALRPVWDELKDRPRTNYPTGFVLGTPLPGSVETVGSFVSNTVYIPFATMLATEGSAAAEQR